MWPAKHGRGKGPPCPRVCILKQQGWWHRRSLDTVEGEKPEVIRCLCTRGEWQSQTTVRQSIYPNSPGGLFLTPACLLTSVFRKLTQRQRNRYKDFPYTQPLPQELPTFVNLVSCTYPLSPRHSGILKQSSYTTFSHSWVFQYPVPPRAVKQ